MNCVEVRSCDDDPSKGLGLFALEDIASGQGRRSSARCGAVRSDAARLTSARRDDQGDVFLNEAPLVAIQLSSSEARSANCLNCFRYLHDLSFAVRKLLDRGSRCARNESETPHEHGHDTRRDVDARVQRRCRGVEILRDSLQVSAVSTGVVLQVKPRSV